MMSVAIRVLWRLSSILDLAAAEERYHQTFNMNFRTGRQVQKRYRTNSEHLLLYVVDIMLQHSEDDTSYSSKHT